MPTPLHLKPATAAWIIRERKRLGLKPRDVAERLQAMNLDSVSEATVKVWEANGDRRPSPENLAGLERLFGSKAPDQQQPTGDIAAALRDQAEAIRELAEAIREDRNRISPEMLTLFLGQLRSEGWLTLPETPASTVEAQQPAEVRG